MKNLLCFYDPFNNFHAVLEDIKPPTASDLGPNDVLISVSVAGSNPKDFKHPHPQYSDNKLNQGDDCARVVAAIGPRVRGFRPGDRVAGLHHPNTPHGTYAEYAICPSHTAFHLPDRVSDEETTTMPLVAYTAAVGLY